MVSLRVSFKTPSLASPVFAPLFSPRFSENHPLLSSTEDRKVLLPEDGLEAMDEV